MFHQGLPHITYFLLFQQTSINSKSYCFTTDLISFFYKVFFFINKKWKKKRSINSFEKSFCKSNNQNSNSNSNYQNCNSWEFQLSRFSKSREFCFLWNEQALWKIRTSSIQLMKSGLNNPCLAKPCATYIIND